MARKNRIDRLSVTNATELIESGLKLRSLIVKAQTDLRPFNEQYMALYEVLKSLDAALQSVSGRKPDYYQADLGLLPPAEAG